MFFISPLASTELLCSERSVERRRHGSLGEGATLGNGSSLAVRVWDVLDAGGCTSARVCVCARDAVALS